MKELIYKQIEKELYDILKSDNLSRNKQAKKIFRLFKVNVHKLKGMHGHRFFITPCNVEQIHRQIIECYQTPNEEKYTGFDKYIDTVTHFRMLKIINLGQ